MDSARRIELQVPEDLAYLVANVRRAAAASINEAFPPVDDSTEDELHKRIEELVNEYITQTFSLAAPNLSINGLPVDASHFLSPSASASHPLSSSEPEVVFEPFDARKRARVEALTAEEEDLLRDIARLKKSVPGTTAASWADAARRGIREDEEALERANSSIATNPFASARPASASDAADSSANGSSGALSGVAALHRQDEVEAGFGNAVRGLARVKTEMPAVVARMERARKAGEYVVTER
ncbi:hypothetical protein GGS24DRAFT_12563 [Hypoxylon argillaceum]|nr:hypothetical protein GGS24DRAFT_12563 [Hypoxylon argillaceum]